MNHVGRFRLRSRVVGGAMAALILTGAAAQIALSSPTANAIDCTLAAVKPNVSTDGRSIEGNGQISCSTPHTLSLTVTLQVLTGAGWQKVSSSSSALRQSVFIGGSTKFAPCGRASHEYRSKATGSADKVDLGSDISNLTTSC